MFFDDRNNADFSYVDRPDLSSIGKGIRSALWVHSTENANNRDFVDEVKATGITLS